MLKIIAITSAFFAVMTVLAGLVLEGWNKLAWTICAVALVLAIGNAVNIAGAPDWVRYLIVFLVLVATFYVCIGGPGTLHVDSPRKTRPNWPWE